MSRGDNFSLAKYFEQINLKGFLETDDSLTILMAIDLIFILSKIYYLVINKKI